MGKLRKRPGTDADEGFYEISGSLDGITGPGRRRVVELELRDLDGDDLSVLGAFGGLRTLRIERSRGIDLSTLPRLPGLALLLDRISEVQLSALDRREDLAALWLIRPDRCDVPDSLRLSASLTELYLNIEGGRSHAAFLHGLIEAIDWPRLEGLRSLDVRVSLDAPLGVDLGFLRHLPALERLRLRGDVRHAGSGTSPLEPPFAGLSKHLVEAEFETRCADRVKAELQRYLGVPVDPTAELPAVGERYGWEPGDSMWEVTHGGYGWEMFGSFARAASRPLEEEAGARTDAQQRLVAADPELADRIEMDPMPPGTGVLGASREDLEATIAILGLRPAGAGPTDSEERLAPGGSWSSAGAAADRWVIHASAEGGWSVYGSFADLFGRDELEEEYEAVREAQRRLKAQDRELEERLEFDHESDATGVYAASKQDLEAMLAILRGDAPE